LVGEVEQAKGATMGKAMDLDSLNLKRGKWVVANCGKFPSEKNCQLVIMAPDS